MKPVWVAEEGKSTCELVSLCLKACKSTVLMTPIDWLSVVRGEQVGKGEGERGY